MADSTHFESAIFLVIMKNYHLYLSFLFLSAFHITLAQNRTMGLFLNSEAAYNGYTLLSNNESIYLIDNCGKIVNSWESEYKTGHGTYLMPNGDLLRAGAQSGSFDAGGKGGIFERYDWEGNLKWQYEINNETQQAHHDIAILPNGNFLCTVWERKREAKAKEQGRKYDGEVWSERIIEIEMLDNNQAKIVWEWSIWDHLVQDFDSNKPNFGTVAQHAELLDINYIGAGKENFGNWLHINAIDYNVELDQIAISSRNLSEIYIIDHSTTTQEASTHQGGKYGKGGDILYRYGNPQVYQQGTIEDKILSGQHDIRWIEKGRSNEGEFIVFNNEYVAGQQSSVQIFNNPADKNGHYTYNDLDGFGQDSIIRFYTHPALYSDILSGAEVMPNGNILILDGRSGHLFEINEQDELVWDYIYPVNRNGGRGIQGGEPRFNLVFRAKKYPVDYAAFQGKTLLPDVPIELSPIEDNCTLTSTHHEPLTDIKIINTLIQESLYIDNPSSQNTTLYLYDLSQKLIHQHPLNIGHNHISTHQLPNGFFIAIIAKGKEPLVVEKVVKL